MKDDFIYTGTGDYVLLHEVKTGGILNVNVILPEVLMEKTTNVNVEDNEVPTVN